MLGTNFMELATTFFDSALIDVKAQLQTNQAIWIVLYFTLLENGSKR